MIGFWETKQFESLHFSDHCIIAKSLTRCDIIWRILYIYAVLVLCHWHNVHKSTEHLAKNRVNWYFVQSCIVLLAQTSIYICHYTAQTIHINHLYQEWNRRMIKKDLTIYFIDKIDMIWHGRIHINISDTFITYTII